MSSTEDVATAGMLWLVIMPPLVAASLVALLVLLAIGLLPKVFRFEGTEVVVKYFGNGVLLLPVTDPWATLESGVAASEPGFVLMRGQHPVQTREDIDDCLQLADWTTDT